MSDTKLYTPPYTVKDVHILPFKEKKIYRPDGTYYYEPLEPTHKTTGIPLMDDYIRWLAGGGLGYDRTQFFLDHHVEIVQPSAADRLHNYHHIADVPTNRDFSGMIKILFGMEVTEFQTAYCLRTAKLLLTHTDLPIDDVAKRASMICSSNLARVFRKQGLPAPKVYRQRRRKELGVINTTIYKL